MNYRIITLYLTEETPCQYIIFFGYNLYNSASFLKPFLGSNESKLFKRYIRIQIKLLEFVKLIVVNRQVTFHGAVECSG